jgi:hypothetical protein
LKINFISIIYILLLQFSLFFFLYKKKYIFINKKKNNKIFSDYIVNLFCLIYLIFFLLFLFKNYFLLEYFTELRDNAFSNTSFAFLNNINPFSEKYFEEFGNLYSLLYPLILAKIYTFFNLQTNQLFLHLNLLAKIINLLVVFAIVIFFLFFLYNKKKNLIFFLLVLSSFILSPWISGTNPNLFGYFFFLTGLGAFFFQTNHKYNFISYFLIFVSSFFKQYYILGIIPIFLTSFFFKKKISDFIYLFLIFFFYFLLFYNNNTYFEIIFHFFLKYSSEVKFEFIRFFFESYFILIAFPFLFFFPICSYIFKINLNTKQIIFVKTYFILIFFVIVKMWTNEGNFGNYTIQLFTPLLLFLTIIYFNQIKLKHNIDKLFFIILLSSCLFINNSRIYGIMSDQYIETNKITYNYVINLKKLNNDKLFFLDSFVSSYFFNIKSNVVYDAGQRNYLSQFKKNQTSFTNNFHEIFTDEYDFIICSLECTKNFNKYKLVEKLTFYTLKQGKIDLQIFKKINKSQARENQINVYKN